MARPLLIRKTCCSEIQRGEYQGVAHLRVYAFSMSVSMQRFPRLKALPCVDLDLARAIPYTGTTNYFFLPHIIANTISCQDPCRWSIGAMELWPASSWGYNKIQLSKISVVSYRCGPLPASRATPQSTFALFSSLPLPI